MRCRPDPIELIMIAGLIVATAIMIVAGVLALA
jgi:hypothetical protein